MSEIPELEEEIPSAESLEQINNLVNDPAIVDAFHKLLEKKLPGLVAPVVKRIWESLLAKSWEPMMEDLFRKVVKEEMFKSAGTWLSKDGASSSEPRKFALEFLGKVGSKVYTGELIKGEDGHDIRVALKDADGNLVKSGTEASSEVELMVSGSSGKEPRISPNRLTLKHGLADLENLRLRRPVADQNTRRCSVWAPTSTIKLIARSVGDFNGATVERAETGSFLFADRRAKLYNKHFPPKLNDEVWRLKEIRRNHDLHRLLEKESINSVEQFLIAHTKDPQSLQQRLKISANKLKTIADHAKTCPDIPKSLHSGQGFVPSDNLSEDLKVDARKKTMSAFEHSEDVQPYNIESSTSHPPCPEIGYLVDSTSVPNEDFWRLDCENSLEPNNAMVDEVDLPAIISTGYISSPEWFGFGYTPMLQREDYDDLPIWIASQDARRGRGRLITCILSVERFISTGKGAMAQGVEARALKKQRCS